MFVFVVLWQLAVTMISHFLSILLLSTHNQQQLVLYGSYAALHCFLSHADAQLRNYSVVHYFYCVLS